MNDPHVESLTYRLQTGETLEFDDPPPLEQENDALRLRLAEDVLTVWPKEHYAREEEARVAIEPYLRAWETSEAIRRFGRREMRFVFDSSQVVDRNPPPPGSPQVVQARASSVGSSRAVAFATVISRESRYPRPPGGFVASPEVESMLGRYEGYLKGREPLPSMAYFCLTVLEHGARDAPAKKAHKKIELVYNVHKKVSGELSRLTSTLGDESTARKAEAVSGARPHTDGERRWIERCVLALIRRAGERAANPQKQLPPITMADLPSL
ncbi:MAG: hypothetical protein M3R38_20940 [Actinomycetota bacterium]|nr:hypothetical protein [Actinomycetota bacterium]